MNALRTALWFMFVWLLSVVVAFAVAVGFAQSFNAGEEFIAVQFLLVFYSLISVAALGVTYLFGKSVRPLGFVAIGLVAAAIVLALFPVVYDAAQLRQSANYRIDMRQNIQLLVELLVPIFIMVTMQWWAARRRWLKRSRPAQSKPPAV